MGQIYFKLHTAAQAPPTRVIEEGVGGAVERWRLIYV